MLNFKNIGSFVVRLVIGSIFVVLSILIYLSLFSYNPNDTGFGVANESNEVSNWIGLFGSYVSSFLILFFQKSAYLLTTFFFILGFRLFVGLPNKLVLFKFFLTILGIVLFNIFLEMIRIDSGLIGGFIYDQMFISFSEYLRIQLVFIFSLIFIFLLSIFLILKSWSIKIKSTFSLFYFLSYLKYSLRPLILILSLFGGKGVKPINSIYKTKIKNYKKSEPTIKKDNTKFRKTIQKNYDNEIREFQYILPTVDLLKTSNEKTKIAKETERKNLEFSQKLEKILSEYGVDGKIVNYKYGPVVTLYEFLPAAGIKTSKVVSLSDDIARAMSSISTRISAQPGKTSIGIEIPNSKREDVLLGDLIKDDDFSSNKEGLILALGKNISGEKQYTDLEKMPHLLIAGTTGSGKSVGINAMIVSLLYKFSPSECKLILIDPKMLELSIYEDIPHLLTPVVTNPNKAVFALKWVVREMENRYRLMSSLNVKNIKSFNEKIISTIKSGRKLFREVQTGIDGDTRKPIIEKKEIPLEKMPLIVVVIDEMADLMMVAGKEVENLVQRLAQMARASGIHLIAATQRPSVDVITGTIKANFPSRISFRVASRFDSRTILNEMGAEQLLGSGDMLFLENGSNITRLHGGYVSESEIELVVNHIKSQSSFNSSKDITIEDKKQNENLDLGFENKDVDELYDKAVSIIVEQQKVSTSFIQRYLQIGYNRAARIVEKMEEDGYISEASHSGKRSVLKKNR